MDLRKVEQLDKPNFHAARNTGREQSYGKQHKTNVLFIDLKKKPMIQ